MSAIPFYKSVYETHFLAGDSGRSRGLDHRAMPGAPVSYRLRARMWPNHTPLEKKLYGTTEELALTVDYIVASGLTV